MPINELRSITTFARTAELGSIRRAAEAQGISPQAASQALAQLEQHLGVRLFHRIDLVIQRVADNPEWFMTSKELAAAEAKGRKAHRRR